MGHVYVPAQGELENFQRLAHVCSHGAIYDSAERQPFSQCLPDTRVDLLADLREHVATSSGKIIWLSGESGCGKSTVAHTLADQLRQDGSLAATFFFSRKDDKRSDTDTFFLTIAYQLGLLHPRAKGAIGKAIAEDTALLSPEKSRREQFEKLVVLPLKLLAHPWKGKVMGIVVDAADEGETNRKSQIKPLISMLAELVADPALPISSIVITSRPWPLMDAMFQHELQFQGVIVPVLMLEYDAVKDVKRYLQSSLIDIDRSHGLSFLYQRAWPTDEEIELLSQYAHGRFIFAATIVRLVDSDHPDDRLALVLRMLQGGVETHEYHSIDHLYRCIISEVDESIRATTCEYLAVIAHMNGFLSPSDLKTLLGIDPRPFLLPLSAIISIPPPGSATVLKVYHASLIEFLLDPSRSREFHVEPAAVHRRLTQSCFILMARSLKRNICRLEDASMQHSTLWGTHGRVEENVSLALQYSCYCWGFHLNRSSTDYEIQRLLTAFLQKHLMFAIEVCCLIGRIEYVVGILMSARDGIALWHNYSSQETSLALINDAIRLITEFGVPIRQCVLHLYESALAFSPARSQIRRTYKHLIRQNTEIQVEHGLDDDWDCVLHTICLYPPIESIVVSPNRSFVAAITRDRFYLFNMSGLLLATFLHCHPRRDALVWSYAEELLAFPTLYDDCWQCINLQTMSGFSIPAQTKNTVIRTPIPYRMIGHPKTGALAFSHDGTRLACSYSFGMPEDGDSIMVWDPNMPHKGTVLELSHLQITDIQSLLYSHRDDQIMATTSSGAYFLDSETGSIMRTITYQFLPRFWHFFDDSGESTIHIDPHPASLCVHLSTPLSPLLTSVDLESATSDIHPFIFNRRLVAIKVANTVYSRHGRLGSWDEAAQAKKPLMYAQLDYRTRHHINVLDLTSLNVHIPNSDGLRTELLPSFGGTRYPAALVEVNQPWTASVPDSNVMIKTFEEPHSRTQIIDHVGLSQLQSGFTLSPRMDVYSYRDTYTDHIHLVQIAGPNFISKVEPTFNESLGRRSKPSYRAFSSKSTYFVTANAEQLELWETRSGLLLARILAEDLSTETLTFSDDELRIAWVQESRTRSQVVVWDIRDSHSLPSLPCLGVNVCNVHLSFPSKSTLRLLYHGAALKTTIFLREWQEFQPFSVLHPAAVELREQYRLISPQLSDKLYVSPSFERIYTSHDSSFFGYYRPRNYKSTIALTLKVSPASEAETTANRGVYEQEIPEFEAGADAQYDVRSWSNVTIGQSGWLRVGARKVCWLPPQYRSKLRGFDAQGFHVVGNKIILVEGPRSLGLRVLGTRIKYYH